ncbi:non-reducing end alpha-L-arabinofuranosidase family hydrolase [Prosthecobacter sp.]|uniref:non-reducing end alpha-L-arabinofuranosidase family hydrolase n=1 Tax=Prosthecobacter sp. TaxID=1965333 RepID=UPI0037841956
MSLFRSVFHTTLLVFVWSSACTVQADEPEWRLGAPLLNETTLLEGKAVRLLDPCIVKHEGVWHIFASANGGTVHASASNFDTRPIAPSVVKLPVGSCFVPQVFFYRPQSRWHLIGMMPDKTGRYPKMAPCLCTNTDITQPQGWSAPEVLDVPPPQDEAKPVKQWIDFWVICDAQKAHLFVTSDGGRLWRSETPLANYPHGWSAPVIALRGDFIYAPHVYRQGADGKERYLLTLTARASDGMTYQQNYAADRLDAEWRPVAATAGNPFAGRANVKFDDANWQGDINHGEPLRQGSDERQILEADFSGFIFHGGRKGADDKALRGLIGVGLLERLKSSLSGRTDAP